MELTSRKELENAPVDAWPSIRVSHFARLAGIGEVEFGSRFLDLANARKSGILMSDSGLNATNIIIAVLLAAIFALIVGLGVGGEVVTLVIAFALLVALFAKNNLGLKRPTYDLVRFATELSLVLVFGIIFVYGCEQVLTAFPPISLHLPILQLESRLFIHFGYFLLGLIFVFTTPFIPDLILRLLDGKWYLDRYGWWAWVNTPIDGFE